MEAAPHEVIARPRSCARRHGARASRSAECERGTSSALLLPHLFGPVDPHPAQESRQAPDGLADGLSPGKPRYLASPGGSQDARFGLGEWSRHSDLNRGPAVYETAALPLSYVGRRPNIADAFKQQLFPRSSPNGESGPVRLDIDQPDPIGQLAPVETLRRPLSDQRPASSAAGRRPRRTRPEGRRAAPPKPETVPLDKSRRLVRSTLGSDDPGHAGRPSRSRKGGTPKSGGHAGRRVAVVDGVGVLRRR
jgi:hypothetical protein